MDTETFNKIMDEEFRDDDQIERSQTVIQRLKTKLVTKDQINMCAICLKTYRKGETLFQLECSHHYHTSCIEPWLTKNTQCPTCRHNLT